ncbi:unnamed protein product, partial [Didymodactylos carnosus]
IWRSAVFSTPEHKLTIPGTIPSHSKEIQNATQLDINLWKQVFQNNDLCRGLLLSDLGPESSFEPILQFKNDALPKFKISDSSYIEAHLAYTKRSNSYIRSKFAKFEPSLQCPFLSTSFKYDKEETEARTKEEKTIYTTCTFNFPRVIVKLDESYLEPTEHFRHDVECLFSQPSNEQLEALHRVFDKYGHVIASEITLGAQLYHTEIESTKSDVDEESYKNSKSVGFKASLQNLNVGVGVSGGKGHGKRKNNNKLDQKSCIVYEATGGDTTLSRDPGKWTETISNVLSWRVIKYNSVVPVYEILSKHLQHKVKLITKRHLWSENLYNGQKLKILKEKFEALGGTFDIKSSKGEIRESFKRGTVRQYYELIRQTFYIDALIIKHADLLSVDDTDYLIKTIELSTVGSLLIYYDGHKGDALTIVGKLRATCDYTNIQCQILLNCWAKITDDDVKLLQKLLKGDYDNLSLNIQIEGSNQVLDGKEIKLSLDNVTSTRSATENIAKVLKCSKTVTIFSARSTKMTTETILPMIELLETDYKLTTIDLRRNEISDDGARALAEMFKVNRTLTTIDLSCNPISGDGARALAEMLKVNRTLTTINLFGNGISDDGAKALAEILKVNRTLTTIDLSYNRISGDGAKALAEMLKVNRTLTTINLFGNGISDDGAKALAERFKLNRTLTTIDLRRNKISDDGARALAKMLKVNTTLTTINLAQNEMSADGARALAEMLKVNRTLTTINLFGNGISDDGARALAEMFKVNRTLTTIDLSYNPIFEDGAKALAEMLKVNTTLTTINLAQNEISAYGARALAEMFTVNRTLTTIDLNYNRISDDEAKALAEMLKVNTTLRTINLAQYDLLDYLLDDLLDYLLDDLRDDLLE